MASFQHGTDITCSSKPVIDYSRQEVTCACRWYITGMCICIANQGWEDTCDRRIHIHAEACCDRGLRWCAVTTTSTTILVQSMQWHSVQWLITLYLGKSYSLSSWISLLRQPKMLLQFMYEQYEFSSFRPACCCNLLTTQ